MAAYVPVEAVEVWCWGQQVGAVALDSAMGAYAFEYAPGWLDHGVELAPLHMPRKRGVFTYSALPEATYRRLPALLADALPDEFGNALIDAWLARKGLGKHQVTPLDRLAYLGKRAMGALEFRPVRGPRHTVPSAIEMGQLVEAARAVSMGQLTDERETQAALMNLIQVGTSAGGQRAKAVVCWNQETGQMRSGQIAQVDDGFDHWLLKIDGVAPTTKNGATELGQSEGWGRVEYAYWKMAAHAGIEMSHCRLLEENGRAHFMTRRFDRGRDGRKDHVATLCAMDHLDYKQRGTHEYDQLFSVIDRLGLGAGARQEAFRRMAFNVMARNHDDHTKNFGFRLREGGEWELAPAYDVTFAYHPQSVWVSQHLMAVNGKFDAITWEDLVAVGTRHGVAGMRDIGAQVREAVTKWAEFAVQAGVGEDRARMIAGSLQPLDQRR